MRRIISLTVAVAALAVTLVGCAPAGTTAPSPTPSLTTEPETDFPVATETPDQVHFETLPPVATDPPVAEVIVPVNPGVYMTPSGTGNSVDFVPLSRNIACNIYAGGDYPTFWGCKAREFTFDPGPRTSEYCHMVGSVEGMDDDPVKFGCRTDEPFRGAYDDTVAVLDYGKSITYGGVECVSREDGMTCNRASSGHGFDMSRTEANIW